MKVPMTQKQITGHQKSNVWVFYLFFPSRMNFLSKKYYYLPAVQSIVITFLFSFFEEVDGGPCVLHIIEILAFHSAKWGAGRVVMAGLAQTGCLICSWHPVLRNTSCRDGREKKAQLITLTQQEVAVQCRSLWYLSCSGEKRAVRS